MDVVVTLKRIVDYVAALEYSFQNLKKQKIFDLK
jgi:hypothetical protein